MLLVFSLLKLGTELFLSIKSGKEIHMRHLLTLSGEFIINLLIQ